MFWTRTAKQEPSKPNTRRMITNSQDRISDGLVLQHLVKYIEIMSRESQSGFKYCSDRLRDTAKTVQSSELRASLMSQADMLDHMKDRMEYIDAHKVQSWDDAKYRRFIEQFCPQTDDDE